MILYLEDPKYSTRNLLELIKECRKVTEYKINTHKSKGFLYISDRSPERETKKTASFTIASKTKKTNKQKNKNKNKKKLGNKFNERGETPLQ